MMKRFCFFLMAVAAVFCAVAQSDLVAILQSGDEITPYFGVTAFVNANKAAKNGDIITLSSGTFNTADITKSITVKGACMVNDHESATVATTMNGNLPIAGNLNVTLEGLKINGNITKNGCSNSNVVIRNCYLNTISHTSTNSYKCENYTFTLINCILNGGGINLAVIHQFICINSYINVSPAGANGLKNCSGKFENCMIVTDDPLNNFTLTNCIIQPTADLVLGESCTYNNCVAVGEPNADFWANALGTGGRSVNGYDMFERYEGVFQHGEDLKLKDTVTYTDGNGSQIGMYGGKWPFSSKVSGGLQITRFDVAPKSSTDGKLSVEIDVAIPQ